MAGSETNSAKRRSSRLAAKSDGGANDGKKVRSGGVVAGAQNGFALADFLAPAVAHYLGVRSLVRFGAACKSHGTVVSNEVARRKERVASIEAEVKALMGDPLSVPLRANVIAAKKLADTAKRLIDDEIDFHRKLGTRELSLGEYWGDGPDWREFDILAKKFRCEARAPLGSLVILADCFYFPPVGEASSPSEEEVQKASYIAGRIWGAEELRIYEFGLHDPNSDQLDFELDFEQLFRKCRLPDAGHFMWQCMKDIARTLASNGTQLDAFRIAARNRVMRTPGARDCLLYTLEKADEFVSRGSGDGEY